MCITGGPHQKVGCRKGKDTPTPPWPLESGVLEWTSPACSRLAVKWRDTQALVSIKPTVHEICAMKGSTLCQYYFCNYFISDYKSNIML